MSRLLHMRPLLPFVAVACLAGSAFALLSPVTAAPAGGAPAITVSTAQVETKPFDIILNTVGTIRPWQSVVVRPRIDGEIKALHFTEGQDVKAGTLLVEIDSRAVEATVAEAKAQRQNFEAQLRQAQLDLDRSRRLAANGNASAQSVDQLEARAEQLRAQVASAEAQYQAAQVQLDYTRITAPIDGRVGLRRVDAGNLVRASDSEGIVTLNQLNPIAVVLTLPQQDLPNLQTALATGNALPVNVRTDVNGADIATGKLDTLDNAINENTGTVAIKAMLQNDQQKLWPGQAMLVRIVLKTLPDAVQVPLTAIQRGPESNFVYRVRDNKAELVPVRITYQNDRSAVIEGEIAAGDTVVTDGQLRLKPGSSVRTAAPAQAANAAQ